MNQHRIAIPIAAVTWQQALRRLAQAEPLADLIEIRLDYLKDFSLQDPLPTLHRFLQATDLPLILTYHPDPNPSPAGAPSLAEQIQFWSLLFPLADRRAIYFDLDIELVRQIRLSQNRIPWDHIIASYHDFHGAARNLAEIYEKMAATPAAILKIAALAPEISDTIAIYTILARARREGRKLIALSMGPAGLLTRVLGPSWGAELTFGSLSPKEETAPGQLTAHELRHLYRVPRLTADENIVGIIGNPVGHSLSPLIHNTVFSQMGLDWVYLPLLVTDLGRFMRDFVHPASRGLRWNLRGLSVTIPHKIQLIPQLDELDRTARRVGAVNTLVVKQKRLVGYNTDVAGALQPLQQRIPLKGARVVILGAGGAAHAVAFGLAEAGAKFRVLARKADRADALASRFGGASGLIAGLDQFEYDVLINATPVGLESQKEASLVAPHLLKPGTIVFDLIPRAEETALLRAARSAGCIPINGLEMLVHQAARQFELWTGMSAPLQEMLQAVWPDYPQNATQ